MRLTCATIAVCMAAGAAASSGQVLNEDSKLAAADGAPFDDFGVSVAVSGTTAIVGARWDDDGTSNSGSAYLFDTATEQQLHKLTAAGGAFGTSVGISGNIAIVGAPFDDHAGQSAGSAYLFDITTGQQLFKLTAADAATGHHFGISVAISGTTAIVGARDDDSAYIFDATTGQQRFKLTASEVFSGWFGYSVAISGTTAIVGARKASVDPSPEGAKTGLAYLFDTTTGQQLHRLAATDGADNDAFGQSVAIFGNTAVVGASNDTVAGVLNGSAYIFDVATGQQLFKLTAADAAFDDQLGWSVAISGTAGTAIVGAHRDDDNGDGSGSAYVFDLATGQQLYKLHASDAALGDLFGSSVASSGSTTILGARQEDTWGSNSGSAYVFAIDSDGDGLLDDWEKNGIPYTDSNGVLQRYILDSDGDGQSDANWLKKDIFVEVDAMAFRAPSAATLQRVVDAFDPPGQVLVPAVPGLDGGLPNVKLHIQTAGDRALTLTNGGNYGSVPTDPYISPFVHFGIDKTAYFGTSTERTGTSVDIAKRLEAKRKAYRYCIFANTYSGGSSSGLAQGSPSDDFMVTLGAADTPGGTADQQAGTFMHELGHALGLGHGGGSSVNYKPNYYSVMNYWWQFPDRWQGNAWGLRYSDQKLPTLDENALLEGSGIGASLPGVRVPYTVPVGTNCPGVFNDSSQWDVAFFMFASLTSSAAVDWDGNCHPMTPGMLAADINDLSYQISPNRPQAWKAAFGAGRTRLEGHNDWLNLHYNVRTTPTYAPGAPAQELFCEYDNEVVAFMSSIPAPPAACPGDIADAAGVPGGDGIVDFGDFMAMLGLIGPCPGGTPGCTGDIADDFGSSGGDGMVSFGDFLALLGLVGPCP